MKEQKRRVFITFNDEVAGHLLAKAKKRIIWAAPSISHDVAIALVAQTVIEPAITIKVVVDPEYDTLQLGYGEFSGIKHLRDNEIDVRAESGLRIGILVVDDRCWIFSPTPRIVEEQPHQGAWNGLVIDRGFTQWLLYALLPEALARDLVYEQLDAGGVGREPISTDDREDDVLDSATLDDSDPPPVEVREFDFEPEIGKEVLSEAQMAEIEEAHEERPPKIFDRQKELRVYSSYFQFVELHMNGGRLAKKKVKLPDHLIEITANTPARIEIEASCQLFENSDIAFPDLRMVNSRVNSLRREYLVVLGDDYGSVILRKRLPAFEKEVQALQNELQKISQHLEERVEGEILKAKEGVIRNLLPVIKETRPGWARALSDDDISASMVWDLDQSFPQAGDVIGRLGLTYVRKDITWEMLNEADFLNMIKKDLGETFTKLYDEATALAEGRENVPQVIPDEVLWPEEIGEEDG